MNSPADRVFVRPILMRHRLIDDDDIGSPERILLGKLAAFQQRNTKRPKIVGTGNTVESARFIAWAGIGAAFDLKAAAGISHHRQLRDCAYGDDATDSAYMFIHRAAKLGMIRWAVVDDLLRQRQFHGDHILRIKSWIHAKQPREAGNHESGATEHYESQCHFGCDQRVAQAVAARARTAATFFQWLGEIAANRMKSGN